MTVSFVDLNNSLAYTTFTVDPRATVDNVSIRVCTRDENDPKDVLEHAPLEVRGGKAKFYWDDNIRNLKAQWYNLKLMINGCVCAVFPMRIQDCEGVGIDSHKNFSSKTCSSVPERTLGSCDEVCPPEECETEFEICPPPEDKRPNVYVPEY